MANMPFMFVALVLLACCAVEMNARRRSPPPLKGQVSKYGRRNHRKSSVCEFGEQTYELDEMWKPDLGVPFGVMDCIQCECVPIQRKRRVIGRVKCRDIKRDCPKPSCKTPVLAKGQCCKTCYNSAAGNLSRARVQDEDEGKSGKEFAVLMTVSGTRDSGLWINSTPSASLGGGGGGCAAAGRLSLKGRVLTYSFFYQRMARPERVVFLDGDQNIVEELPVPPVEPSDYQLISSKVCGQWKKMPRQYRRLLKKERLQVAFASGPPTTDFGQVQLMVSGRVRRDKGLQTETFSGLLLPSDGSTWHGAAGTAIVSLSPVQRGAFHVSLVLQQPAATPSGLPAVAVQSPDGRRQLLVQMNVEGSANLLLDELIEVDAGKSGEVVLEASTTLQPAELRHLSRGRIRLSVRLATVQHRVISCLLMPRLTCNTFTALLSGAGSLEDPAPITPALGVARLQLWNNGSLQFSVHLERMDAQVLAIQLAADDKRPFVVEDLLPHYIQSWSNGTLTRLNPRDITALLEEKLVLDVETDRYRSELRGRLLGLVSDEAHVGTQLFPITLHAHNSSSAGAVWLAVDSGCALHYDVQIVDRAGGGRRLELVELPRRQKHDRILTEFRGDRVENRIGHLPKTTLYRLSQGETVLRVVPLQNGHQLSSEQVKVSVPKQCVPRRPGRVIGFFQDQSEYEDNEIRTSTECEYKGSVYGDGDQWDALHDSCTVCQCYRGRVRCHRIVCPTLQCTNQLRHPDSCCPVCHNVTVPAVDTVTVASLGCSLAGRFRPVGSVWHPYLPPMGFAKCVVCKCQMVSNGSSASVACSSKPCPKLDCPGREFLPDAAACCKQCQAAPPPTQKTFIGGSTALARKPTGALQDEAREISGIDLLLHGGCHRHGVYYSNGDTWHPRIATIGLLPCYTCRCRMGEISCYKEKCRKLSCSVTRHYRDQCCPVCVDAVLFHEKAKRRRRHSPP